MLTLASLFLFWLLVQFGNILTFTEGITYSHTRSVQKVMRLANHCGEFLSRSNLLATHRTSFHVAEVCLFHDVNECNFCKPTFARHENWYSFPRISFNSSATRQQKRYLHWPRWMHWTWPKFSESSYHRWWILNCWVRSRNKLVKLEVAQANLLRPTKARKSKLKIKLMIIYFMDSTWIINKKFVPPKQTVNQHFHREGSGNAQEKC